MADYKVPFISGAAPSVNDVLHWNGSDWVCHDMTASVNTMVDSAISDINTMVDSAISDVVATAVAETASLATAIASVETTLSDATSDARSLASAAGGGGVTESHMDSAIASIETALSDATSDALSVATVIGFVDRGDPAANDYAAGDLVDDQAWNDLDLGTDIPVPANAKAVLLKVVARDNAVGSYVQFRKNGNANNIAITSLFTQVVGEAIAETVTIACDSDRKIEIRTFPKPTNWTSIAISINGWWINI